MPLFNDQHRQVFRRLARAPLFTSITLLTLAIGIGANTVVFSVVEGVLLKPLSYPHPEQLIGVWYKAPGVGVQDLNIGPFLYFIDREQNTTLQDIGVYNGDSASVTEEGQPEYVQCFNVSDGTLPLLEAKPALGRLFTRQDDSPGAPKTVILTYGYWQRRFGGSNSVIGRTLTVDGSSREIIGVLPRDFLFLDDTKASLYLPLQLDRSKTIVTQFSYQGLARLKPGVTLSQASADMARLIPVAIRSFPMPQGVSLSMIEKAQLQPNLKPLKKVVVGDVGNVLWVLMGSIVVVLLVACANVANLLLVRVEGRRQELAIRSALGAGRASITVGLLFESLVLGVGGSLIGLGLAFAALRVLLATAPPGLPRIHEIGVNLPVLLFTLLLAILVSVAIGAIPALKYSGVQMNTGLRAGGRSSSQSREHHRARKALVVVQVALALMLLICSGLMIRTFWALVRVTPGFADPGTLQTFSIDIPEAQIPGTQPERVLRMEQAIADRLGSIPGVQSVSFATPIPMDGNYTNDPIVADDHPSRQGELAPMRRYRFIAPGFFATMGTPLIAGRDVTWPEEYEKRPVAIISENFAREYWGDPAKALGKHLRENAAEDWREIIGVARDTYDDGADKPAPTFAYWPLFQDRFNGNTTMVRRYVSYVIRTPRAGSSALMNEMQQMVWSVNPDLALADARTVEDLYRKSMARTSFTLVMLCVAGGMALLLGIVGIYGVVSYAVSQQTREIGIRMALGAQREAMIRMFVREGMLLTGIGVVCGIAAAFATMRVMASILFKVSPMDPVTYSIATVCVVTIAGLASYLPSRRAAVVDPVNALRAE